MKKHHSTFFQLPVLLLRSLMSFKLSTLCTEYCFPFSESFQEHFFRLYLLKFQQYVLNLSLFAFTALCYLQSLFYCFFSSVVSLIIDYYYYLYSIIAILVTFWRKQSINMQIQAALWIQILQRLPYHIVSSNSFRQVS